MIYQDTWTKGKAAEKGYRECAARYEIVKAFCERFSGPFTVCDIGANMCYFGLRLTEDFPSCSVMAFEFDHFAMRQAHVAKTERLILLNRKLSIKDIRELSHFCRFDVVLAMSVMHHLPGDSGEWLEAFRILGRNIIAEFAGNDSARPAIRKGYGVPSDAVVLGYGGSHLKQDFQRPIVLISSKENA